MSFLPWVVENRGLQSLKGTYPAGLPTGVIQIGRYFQTSYACKNLLKIDRPKKLISSMMIYFLPVYLRKIALGCSAKHGNAYGQICCSTALSRNDLRRDNSQVNTRLSEH